MQLKRTEHKIRRTVRCETAERNRWALFIHTVWRGLITDFRLCSLGQETKLNCGRSFNTNNNANINVAYTYKITHRTKRALHWKTEKIFLSSIFKSPLYTVFILIFEWARIFPNWSLILFRNYFLPKIFSFVELSS